MHVCLQRWSSQQNDVSAKSIAAETIQLWRKLSWNSTQHDNQVMEHALQVRRLFNALQSQLADAERRNARSESEAQEEIQLLKDETTSLRAQMKTIQEDANARYSELQQHLKDSVPRSKHEEEAAKFHSELTSQNTELRAQVDAAEEELRAMRSEASLIEETLSSMTRKALALAQMGGELQASRVEEPLADQTVGSMSLTGLGLLRQLQSNLEQMLECMGGLVPSADFEICKGLLRSAEEDVVAANAELDTYREEVRKLREETGQQHQGLSSKSASSALGSEPEVLYCSGRAVCNEPITSNTVADDYENDFQLFGFSSNVPTAEVAADRLRKEPELLRRQIGGMIPVFALDNLSAAIRNSVTKLKYLKAQIAKGLVSKVQVEADERKLLMIKDELVHVKSLMRTLTESGLDLYQRFQTDLEKIGHSMSGYESASEQQTDLRTVAKQEARGHSKDLTVDLESNAVEKVNGYSILQIDTNVLCDEKSLCNSHVEAKSYRRETVMMLDELSACIKSNGAKIELLSGRLTSELAQKALLETANKELIDLKKQRREMNCMLTRLTQTTVELVCQLEAEMELLSQTATTCMPALGAEAITHSKELHALTGSPMQLIQESPLRFKTILGCLKHTWLEQERRICPDLAESDEERSASTMSAPDVKTRSRHCEPDKIESEELRMIRLQVLRVEGMLGSMTSNVIEPVQVGEEQKTSLDMDCGMDQALSRNLTSQTGLDLVQQLQADIEGMLECLGTLSPAAGPEGSQVQAPLTAQAGSLLEHLQLAPKSLDKSNSELESCAEELMKLKEEAGSLQQQVADLIRSSAISAGRDLSAAACSSRSALDLLSYRIANELVPKARLQAVEEERLQIKAELDRVKAELSSQRKPHAGAEVLTEAPPDRAVPAADATGATEAASEGSDAFDLFGPCMGPHRPAPPGSESTGGDGDGFDDLELFGPGSGKGVAADAAGLHGALQAAARAAADAAAEADAARVEAARCAAEAARLRRQLQGMVTRAEADALRDELRMLRNALLGTGPHAPTPSSAAGGVEAEGGRQATLQRDPAAAVSALFPPSPPPPPPPAAPSRSPPLPAAPRRPV
jgi:hypothetical protein